MNNFYGSELFEAMSNNAGVFFLCFARVLALFLTAPLISTRAVSRIAKIALAILVTVLVFQKIKPIAFEGDVFSAHYLLLLAGESLLGVLTGFFVTIIFSVFSTAGQFFSYQMGFSASSVYDALSQVENPLVGQFFNIVAILVFINANGFQNLFLGGILASVQSINSFVFLENHQSVYNFFTNFLPFLFQYAFLIALPITGTLFLIHVTMGLLTKAAPQMNLLSEGFPITIMLTFIILYFIAPSLIDIFTAIIENAFQFFQDFLIKNGGIQDI